MFIIIQNLNTTSDPHITVMNLSNQDDGCRMEISFADNAAALAFAQNFNAKKRLYEMEGPRLQFAISPGESNDRVAITGNLYNGLELLVKVKLISRNLLDSINANSEANALIKESKKCVIDPPAPAQLPSQANTVLDKSSQLPETRLNKTSRLQENIASIRKNIREQVMPISIFPTSSQSNVLDKKIVILIEIEGQEIHKNYQNPT